MLTCHRPRSARHPSRRPSANPSARPWYVPIYGGSAAVYGGFRAMNGGSAAVYAGYASVNGGHCATYGGSVSKLVSQRFRFAKQCGSPWRQCAQQWR
eukprot:3189217-Rhodomonas_salina.1